MVIQLPVGTIVRRSPGGERLVDLAEAGQRFVVAAGGRGGRGNQHFASSTNQAPRYAEEGADGEDLEIDLELKLIADVGLVGAPNAGKSTLLGRVSAARPKVAPYPFTTLKPYVGVVDSGDYRQFVLADIPGLIEGAHEGAGLGDEFLRHIERTSFLLEMVDLVPPDGSDPAETLSMLRKELDEYSRELSARPGLVVGNKLDMPGGPEALAKLGDAIGEEVLGISALTGEGVPHLVGRLFETLRGQEAQSASHHGGARG